MPSLAAQWPEWETQKLRELWAEGHSASVCAERLGTGRSRNAVIGKINRMGDLPRRSPNVTRPPRPRRKRLSPAQRAVFSPRSIARPEFAPPPRLPHELRRIRDLAPLDPTLGVGRLNAFTCRYPIGEPDEPGFAFCGRISDPERPYCCDHARLCYQPGRPKQPAHDRIRPDWREGMAR